MKNKKFKLTFLGAALCFALVGCSNDDSVDGTNNNNSESGVVSNGEITLTYGSDLLKHNVQNLNERLNIQGMNGASARSGNTIPQYPYSATDLNNATELTNSGNVEISNNQIFKLDVEDPSQNGASQIIIKNGGVLFLIGNISNNTSKIQIENGGKLIITGTYAGDKIQPNSGGQVIVAPTGNYTVGNNFNQGSLSNWGITKYSVSTFDGTLVNNKEITFSNTNGITINGSAKVTNNCKMVFQHQAKIDASYNPNNSNSAKFENNSFIDFKEGFNINGSLELKLNSYTKVTGGTIAYNGTINGIDSQMVTQNLPRLDIASSVILGVINGTNRITGLMDLNTTKSATDLRAASTVLFNQNTFVASNDCTEGAGTAITLCSIADLDQQARYIGHVVSPIEDGITLSATDVKVVGTKAYVSYHTNDEIFGGFPYGSIRVFDINSGSVSLVSEAKFNNCEFNALAVQSDKVYAVGNNLDGGRMYVAPTTLFTETPNGTPKNFDDVWSTKTPSLGGKSIAFNNNTLWLVGGSNGGLYKNELVGGNYNLTATTAPFVTQTGGKYVSFNNNKQVFFAINDAGNPYLRIASADGTLIDENTDTDITLTNRDGKNAISVDNDYVYVALSEQGVAKYSLIDGSLVARFVPSTVRNASGSRTFPNNGLSNAVTFDDCYVYVANGADGVIILDKNTFKHVGHFKTGLNHSTNFVYAKDDYLFVANGRDGLRVIKLR